MPNCAVKGCKTSSCKNNAYEKPIRFFSFPRNEDVRRLWIKACNRESIKWQTARVCSLHFTDDDWCLMDKLLATDRSKCTLDKQAVPSQNLTVEMSKVNKTLYDNRVKPKNVLALNEKVAAIRRYEMDPVYKSVGRYFNCSPDQIKRIIKQKDEILNEWENRTKKCKINLAREMKTVKISFLGKAVHEWIRRMMYYTDFNLTDALIQTMAIEFKKALNLPNFFPDKNWVTSFRNTYNLKDVSTKTLGIGYPESQSVQIRDILNYLQAICGSSETEVGSEDFSKPAVTISEGSSDGNCSDNSSIAEEQKYSIVLSTDSIPSTSTVALTAKRKSTLPPDSAPPCKIKTENDVEPIKVKTESEAELTDEQAMHYVKQLEEFALLKENFRLIGLVDRLEEALKENR